ncbi:hypothetical protein CSUI_008361 [Cystoisospora suis]|uniref:Uncharacterized protein n=1 Tax=Cystoisospora suis TaxID=483139 RepID=A0A2C6KMW1_9APIC|nr:hypothetical protein CSUI_008361 [Cystoisospora suis]
MIPGRYFSVVSSEKGRKSFASARVCPLGLSPTKVCLRILVETKLFRTLIASICVLFLYCMELCYSREAQMSMPQRYYGPGGTG